MSRSKKHGKHGKHADPANSDSRQPSRLDPLWRALEWPGATGWVGTLFGVAALWFAVSALVLGGKHARMEAASPDARAAAEESRTWGFGDRFLLSVLKSNEAGVVVRESAEAGARFVAVVLGTGGRARVLVRFTPGRPATRMPLQPAQGQPPPKWIRLVRRDGILEVSVSSDGASWGSGGLRRKLTLAGGAVVGPAVYPATREPCVATFRSVRLVPGPAGEWRDAGEGEAAPPPPSEISGASATVASGGAGGAAAGAASHFAYTETAGDFEITAQVGGIEPGLVLPTPLAGTDLARARLAVAADARASGVFAFFAAALAALLWGLRRFDPSVRAEAAGCADGHPS